MTDAPTQNRPKLKTVSPPVALDWGFLRRTGVSTTVTSLIIGLFASVYFDVQWGARYLLFALWAVAFFGCTALIFKHLLFESRKASGIGFAILKVGLVGFMVGINFWLWPMSGADGKPDHAQVMAMIAGITTPFAVLILRVFGFMMEAQRKGNTLSLGPNPISSTESATRAGNLESHS